jgi:hypothetical protein
MTQAADLLMSVVEIEDYLHQLREKLPYVPPVPVQAIKRLHRRRDFGSVVRLIRETMNVGVHLTLHWTSGPAPGQKAQAWINIPLDMPYYGTPDFKALKMDMFILKSFRDRSTWDEFAIVVAHELSHVVLDSIAHSLRDEEKAVDLTAMLLGFSYLYRCAAHTTRRTGLSSYRTSHLGYLSEPEVNAASKILVPYPMRAQRLAFEITRASVGLIAIAAICFVVWAIGFISDKREVHAIALTEQAKFEKQIPKPLNAFTTLVAARAGLVSFTREYLVTPPKEELIDLGAFERRLRAGTCAENRVKVQRGLSYIYVYRRADGSDIIRIEVSSCP